MNSSVPLNIKLKKNNPNKVLDGITDAEEKSSMSATGLEKIEEQILIKSQKHLESLGIKNSQQQEIFISQITSFASALIDNYLDSKNAD